MDMTDIADAMARMETDCDFANIVKELSEDMRECGVDMYGEADICKIYKCEITENA